MAILTHRFSPLTRTTGGNAVAAAAYRSASKLIDENTGKEWDYTQKKGVDPAECWLLTPEGVPEWAKDRQALWNEVESFESRKNSQLARHLLIALPVELTPEQQRELLLSHLNDNFVSLGMVADVCVHREDPGNPHAHIMLTMRELTPDGFAKHKQRDWNDHDLCMFWDAQWEQRLNNDLALYGHEARVSWRSYEEQGIKLEPTVHEGTTKGRVDGREVVGKLQEQNAEARFSNGEKILADPTIATHALTQKQATFTRRQLGQWIEKNVDLSQQEAVKLVTLDPEKNPELVTLGKDARGNIRYTTKEFQQTEQRMIDNAKAMAARQGHFVSDAKQRGVGIYQSLSADQRAAYHYIMEPRDIAVVQGRAGTGKSYMLDAAREAWQKQGYSVIGAALAGKAADGLQRDTHIKSGTLDSRLNAWERGTDQLTNRDVLVIDEAGMLDTRKLDRAIAYARIAGAKVVLVGDDRQLQPIMAGAAMRGIRKEIGNAEMNEVRRQRIEWQKQATIDFADGRVAQGLDAYAVHGHLLAYRDQTEAMTAMLEAWNTHRHEKPAERQLLMAWENKDVHRLNELVRELRRQAGELGKGTTIETAKGKREFAAGDRIYFLKNDKRLSQDGGVKNGSLGTVERVKADEMRVRLDDGRTIRFDPRQYNDIDHGYAGTAYKSQGDTVDRAHVLASPLFGRQGIHVATSRHRDQADIYWSHEAFPDGEQGLREKLSRNQEKGNIGDAILIPPKQAELTPPAVHAAEPVHDTVIDRAPTIEPPPMQTHAPTPARAMARQPEASIPPLPPPEPVKQPPVQRQPEDPLAIGRRIAGKFSFEELHLRYQRMQDLVAGRLDGFPPDLKTKEHIEKSRQILPLLTPYYEHAKREHEAALAKQAQQKQHEPEPVKQPPAQIKQHEARPPMQPQLDAAVVRRVEIDRVVIATRAQLAQERAQEQQREQAPRPAPEPQKAEPARRELPTVQQAHDFYATLSDAEQIARYEKMKVRGAEGYIGPSQTFEQLPQVKAARAELVAADKAAASWQRDVDRFTREHRVLALRRDPVVTTSEGRKVKLSVGQAEVDERVQKALHAVAHVERDPELRKQVEHEVQEHNRFVDRANWERGLLAPYKELAEQRQRADEARRVERIQDERAQERAREVEFARAHPEVIEAENARTRFSVLIDNLDDVEMVADAILADSKGWHTQATRDPPATPDLDYDERLRDFVMRHAEAARDWADWCADATPEQAKEARAGRGPGSEPYRELCNTREWVETAAREAKVERELQQERGGGLHL